MTDVEFPEPTLVNSGEINLSVHEAGSGPPVILVHGFPELAFSWRHQLPALASAGYHALAPDMRGYGGTDQPGDVGAYTVQKLIGDLTGLMDARGIDQSVIVGHDWGALVAWQMALLNPDRMAGLIALNIPFYPRPPINPLLYMRWKLGKDFYIVNFQHSDEADRRFAENPRKFIDRMMRRGQKRSGGKRGKKGRKGLSLIDLLDRTEPMGEPLLTADELDYYAMAFEKSGFSGAINWYRNFKHNWKSTGGVRQQIDVPTLFVGATEEIVVHPKQIEAMRPHVKDLEIQMIEDCGHWTQQEKPGALNAILLEWLGRRYPN